MSPIKSILRAYFITQTRDKPTGADSKFIQPALLVIQRLPLELIYEITAYLPPSSELALRHTNRWCYANAGPEPALVISDRVCNSPEYRLEYICFLERDAESPRRQFACSVCVQLHPADRFSTDELQKRPESRTCQRAWICEHRTLSLAEYRKVLNSPIGANGLVTYPYSQESVPHRNYHWDQCCTTVWTHRCFGCLDRKDDRTRTLSSRWAIPLSNIIAFGDALARGIENEPAELDFHICPHIKPKDRITDLLACNIESQLTKKTVRRLHCKDCKARFWCFFEDGYFQITCYRFLGYGEANDPSWISQLPPPHYESARDLSPPICLSWRPLRDPTGVSLWILCAALLHAHAGGLQEVSQDMAFQVTKSAHDLSLPLCQRPPRDLTGNRIWSACDLLFLHTYVEGLQEGQPEVRSQAARSVCNLHILRACDGGLQEVEWDITQPHLLGSKTQRDIGIIRD